MTAPLKRWLATLLCSLGLALSLYLALLKFFALPCLAGGGCHAVIHSGYGSVLGVPVGIYGALLWIGAISVSDGTKRAALLCLLALGSAVFMGIQFFVLRSFCLFCTSHAVVSWLALALNLYPPHRLALLAGAVLAFGGFQFTRLHAANTVAATLPPAKEGAPLATAPAGQPWLGPLTPTSPAVVLSLNCAACLDLLGEISRDNFKDTRTGPAIFFKVNDENRELTTTFVAAVLAQSGAKRDAFLATTALLLTVKDLALSAPAAADAQLNALFPAAAAQKDAARKLLEAQTETLHAAHLGDTTPLLVPLSGKPRVFFKVEELFGR